MNTYAFIRNLLSESTWGSVTHGLGIFALRGLKAFSPESSVLVGQAGRSEVIGVVATAAPSVGSLVSLRVLCPMTAVSILEKVCDSLRVLSGIAGMEEGGSR